MSESYETEQKTLEARVAELQGQIAAQQEANVNVNRFLATVRKYTDVRELTLEIISEFVERVEVYKPEQMCDKRMQRMHMDWNLIGEFMPPDKQEKTA